MPSRKQDIFLLIRPLHSFEDRKCAKISGPGSPIKFRRFQHWALRVGDEVFEVRRIRESGAKERRYEYRVSTYRDWQIANRYHVEDKWIRTLGSQTKSLITTGKLATPTQTSEKRPIEIAVGETRMSAAEVRILAKMVGDTLLEHRYSAVTTNCQTYALILFRLTQDVLPPPRKKNHLKFRRLPISFNWFYYKAAWFVIKKLMQANLGHFLSIPLEERYPVAWGQPLVIHKSPRHAVWHLSKHLVSKLTPGS